MVKEHYRERYHRFYEMAKAGKSDTFEYDVYTDHRIHFDDETSRGHAHFHASKTDSRPFEARIAIPLVQPRTKADVRFHSYVTPESRRKGKFTSRDQKEIFDWLRELDEDAPGQQSNWESLIYAWNKQNPDDRIKRNPVGLYFLS